MEAVAHSSGPREQVEYRISIGHACGPLREGWRLISITRRGGSASRERTWSGAPTGRDAEDQGDWRGFVGASPAEPSGVEPYPATDSHGLWNETASWVVVAHGLRGFQIILLWVTHVDVLAGLMDPDQLQRPLCVRSSRRHLWGALTVPKAVDPSFFEDAIVLADVLGGDQCAGGAMRKTTKS